MGGDQDADKIHNPRDMVSTFGILLRGAALLIQSVCGTASDKRLSQVHRLKSAENRVFMWKLFEYIFCASRSLGKEGSPNMRVQDQYDEAFLPAVIEEHRPLAIGNPANNEVMENPERILTDYLAILPFEDRNVLTKIYNYNMVKRWMDKTDQKIPILMDSSPEKLMAFLSKGASWDFIRLLREKKEKENKNQLSDEAAKRITLNRLHPKKIMLQDWQGDIRPREKKGEKKLDYGPKEVTTDTETIRREIAQQAEIQQKKIAAARQSEVLGDLKPQKMSPPANESGSGKCDKNQESESQECARVSGSKTVPALNEGRERDIEQRLQRLEELIQELSGHKMVDCIQAAIAGVLKSGKNCKKRGSSSSPSSSAPSSSSSSSSEEEEEEGKETTMGKVERTPEMVQDYKVEPATVKIIRDENKEPERSRKTIKLSEDRNSYKYVGPRNEYHSDFTTRGGQELTRRERSREWRKDHYKDRADGWDTDSKRRRYY